MLYFSGLFHDGAVATTDSQNEYSDHSDTVSGQHSVRSVRSTRSDHSTPSEQLSGINANSSELRDNLAAEIGVVFFPLY